TLAHARRALLAAWTARAPRDSEPPVRAWPPLRRPDDLPFRAPHFVDQVLSDRELGDRDAPDRRASRVVTTLDLGLQRLMERHLRAYVARERRRGIPNAAALLVDTRTASIRALVGSADFFDDTISGQVNGTLAKRSPGSALKPFAYATQPPCCATSPRPSRLTAPRTSTAASRDPWQRRTPSFAAGTCPP
ncbi:MAG: hypothetical protein ABUL77_04755, partial [Bacteroidota bacterium]